MKSEMNTKAELFQGQSLRSFCLKLMGALFLTVVAPRAFWAQGITSKKSGIQLSLSLYQFGSHTRS